MNRQEKISAINSNIAILEDTYQQALTSATQPGATYSDYLKAYKAQATAREGITRSLIQLAEFGEIESDVANLAEELEFWKSERRWSWCELQREAEKIGAK